MTKLTPASSEAGPAAPPVEEQDASLRRLLAGARGQPPSPQELALVDRLAEVVTERIAASTAETAPAPDGAGVPVSAPGSGSGS